MSAPAPEVGSRLDYTIEVGGSAIDSALQVVSIDTWVSVNKVPRARIVLFDGSAALGDFPVSNLPTFVPGAQVDISAGHDGETRTIFSGVIVKHGIEITGDAGSKLCLDLADRAVVMTLARRSAAFEKVKDSAVIEALCVAHGLAKEVAATTTLHEEIVQFHATDWDLMVTRAEANGMVVMVSGGKVTVRSPDTSRPPVLRVAYGESVLELQAELDASGQFASSAIESSAWDLSTQARQSAGPAGASFTEAGNLSSATLAGVFKVPSYRRQSGAPLGKQALADWSTAELLRSKLGKIQGHVRFFGSALAAVGETIELGGLGDRFNGALFIGGVHHGIRDGSWITTVTFGLSPRPFAAEAPRIAAPDAAGQLPPVKGLQTGVVKQVAPDGAGEVRVLVTMPLLPEGAAVWARLGSFYASRGVGAMFYPEVGDEVVVGFMSEDPRYPVILGSLYSKARPPPLEPDQDNPRKVIVTREKLTLSFDDKEKILKVTTPGGHLIELSDKDGSITIKDSNDNSVSLAKGGITVNSASSIALSAKTDITLSAQGNIKLSAAATASMEGLDVTHKARAKLSAEGAASAELKSAATLTIQGALVMIN